MSYYYYSIGSKLLQLYFGNIVVHEIVLTEEAD